MISSSPSRKDSIAAAEKAVSKIVLRLEPCVPETDAFFADAETAASDMLSVRKADAGGERFPPDAYEAAYAAVLRQDSAARTAKGTGTKDERGEKPFSNTGDTIVENTLLADTSSIGGVIPKGARISDCVPRVLRRLYESDERDWNHRTFAESCALFDEVCPDHPELDAKKFWRAGLRGGVQGMLYFADTIDRANPGF